MNSLPQSNSLIRKVGLGTVQFGLAYGISNREGITPPEEVTRLLQFAHTAGIDLLDTAYGYGKSEEVLGNAGVNNFKVVSKFLPPDGNLTIEAQVSQSLKRLNVNSLYGLLAHRPLSIISHPASWDTLMKLKHDKIIQKTGFSFNTTEEADAVLDTGYLPDLVQVPFNYFDHRFVARLSALRSAGCEIHTRSPFLRGLFFTDPSKLPSFFNAVKPMIIHLQSFGDALPAMLLHYCLQQPFIDKVIFGVNTLNQLVNNLKMPESAGYLPPLNQQISDEILTPSTWPS